VSLWTLIPLLILGYLGGVPISGYLYMLCSRKAPADIKEADADDWVGWALIWPVSLPVRAVGFGFYLSWWLVSEFGMRYSGFLRAKHGEVHAGRNKQLDE
jgi:hypothetical protein